MDAHRCFGHAVEMTKVKSPTGWQGFGVTFGKLVERAAPLVPAAKLVERQQSPVMGH